MNNNQPTPPSRSFNMSKIRAKNTKAEMSLRRLLWKNGVRYRIHVLGIMGKPDIIIKKYRLVIFVDGAFWHGYDWKRKRERIKTNREFWLVKIEMNIERDNRVNNVLRQQGFTVMRFWDHQVLKESDKCLNQILLYIESAKKGKIPDHD